MYGGDGGCRGGGDSSAKKTALACFYVLYCVGFRYFPPAATFPSSVQVGPCHPDNLHLPIAEIGHFLPLTPNLLQYALRM